jgi:hypothetical protein
MIEMYSQNCPIGHLYKSATCLSEPPLDIPNVNYYIFVSYKTATCSTPPTANNFHPQMAKITRSNG